jgi:hypothetical protein
MLSIPITCKYLDSYFADILYIDWYSDIGIRLESMQ